MGAAVRRSVGANCRFLIQWYEGSLGLGPLTAGGAVRVLLNEPQVIVCSVGLLLIVPLWLRIRSNTTTIP
jgi:hypothetical protein